jgi:hypothetical protein
LLQEEVQAVLEMRLAVVELADIEQAQEHLVAVQVPN